MADRLEKVAQAHAIATKPYATDPPVEDHDRRMARAFLAMLDAAQEIERAEAVDRWRGLVSRAGWGWRNGRWTPEWAAEDRKAGPERPISGSSS